MGKHMSSKPPGPPPTDESKEKIEDEAGLRIINTTGPDIEVVVGSTSSLEESTRQAPIHPVDRGDVNTGHAPFKITPQPSRAELQAPMRSESVDLGSILDGVDDPHRDARIFEAVLEKLDDEERLVIEELNNEDELLVAVLEDEGPKEAVYPNVDEEKVNLDQAVQTQEVDSNDPREASSPSIEETIELVSAKVFNKVKARPRIAVNNNPNTISLVGKGQGQEDTLSLVGASGPQALQFDPNKSKSELEFDPDASEKAGMEGGTAAADKDKNKGYDPGGAVGKQKGIDLYNVIFYGFAVLMLAAGKLAGGPLVTPATATWHKVAAKVNESRAKEAYKNGEKRKGDKFSKLAAIHQQEADTFGKKAGVSIADTLTAGAYSFVKDVNEWRKAGDPTEKVNAEEDQRKLPKHLGENENDLPTKLDEGDLQSRMRKATRGASDMARGGGGEGQSESFVPDNARKKREESDARRTSTSSMRRSSEPDADPVPPSVDNDSPPGSRRPSGSSSP